jgi:hypothetical protein
MTSGSGSSPREALAKIVADNDVPDQVRVELEKLVLGLAKDKRALQDRLEEAKAEPQALQQELVKVRADAKALAIEKEAVEQRFAGKEAKISRLERTVEQLAEDLVVQRGKGYNATHIRDFLDQCRHDLDAAVYENHNVGGTFPDPENVTGKYMRRYGQIGGFVPITLTEVKDDRSEIEKRYKEELAHLDALKARFAFALDAIAHPGDVYHEFPTEPERSGWLSMQRHSKGIVKGYIDTDGMLRPVK